MSKTKNGGVVQTLFFQNETPCKWLMADVKHSAQIFPLTRFTAELCALGPRFVAGGGWKGYLILFNDSFSFVEETVSILSIFFCKFQGKWSKETSVLAYRDLHETNIIMCNIRVSNVASCNLVSVCS